MKPALLIVSVGVYLVAIVACSRPASAGADASSKAVAIESHDHDNHQHAAAVSAQSGTQTVAITVGEDGFAPNHVEVKRGGKATLRFIRTSDKTCATAVAFPELGVNKPLPLNQTVDIEVPTDQTRTLTFQCGMGMYKSKVVVL